MRRLFRASSPQSKQVRSTSLLPLPERTERAVPTMGEIHPFLVRAAHVAIRGNDGPDLMLLKEVLDLTLDLGGIFHAATYPAFEDYLRRGRPPL